jgi:hypothetical protein
MLCKQCGAQLSEQSNFCPSCGIRVVESGDQEMQSQQNSARGLKILFSTLLGIIACLILFFFLSDSLTHPIAEQLKLLKENQWQEAYDDYTSQAFQEATSANDFYTFMTRYPILTKHESVRFIDRNVDNDRASLQAMVLTDKGVEIPIQYRLIKEGGEWKIEGIKFNTDLSALETTPMQKNEVFDETPLKSVILSLMTNIRNGDLWKAYEQYTAGEFRKNTSFQEFESFIQNNASFARNVSVELGDLSFDNNVATITGVLVSESKMKYPVEYDLIEEYGKWKLLHIQVLHPDQTTTEFSAGS